MQSKIMVTESTKFGEPGFDLFLFVITVLQYIPYTVSYRQMPGNAVLVFTPQVE